MMRFMNDSKSSRWWILSMFGAATIIGLIGSGQRYVLLAAWNREYNFMPLFFEFTFWYLWAAFCFVIYRISVHYPFDSKTWKFSAFIHLIAGTFFTLLHIVLQAWILSSLNPQESFSQYVQENFVYKVFQRFFFYLMFTGACYAYIFYRRYRRERLILSGLESQLALTQLQTLRMQLNPSFVFATLHSISDVLTRDIETADTLTTRLGDFLRKSLEYPDSPTVPLQKEIEFLSSYLEIHRVQKSESLKIQIEIANRLLEMEVPNLILHQIVDLVFRSSEQIGNISLRGNPIDHGYVIEIEADRSGPDLPFEQIQENLLKHFGDQITLNIKENSKTRLFVTLQVPSSFEYRRVAEPVGISGKATSRLPFLPENWVRQGIWIFGCWTLIALFFYFREYLDHRIQGEPFDWIANAKDYAAWYWWAVFTPVVFALSNRFPITGRSTQRYLFIHTGFAGMIAFVMVIVYMFQRWVLGIAETPFSEELKLVTRYPYVLDMITYFAILGVGEAVQYNRQYLKEELRSTRLRSVLTQAQVQALRMQLQPHFLFNTLNSVAELMHEDTSAAQSMIRRLEDFLRMTVENERMQEVTLRQELEFLQNYLNIQKIRFQNRLNVNVQIDPEVMSDTVPNLILQPIVENAIRHAIAPRAEPGRIDIEAIRRNGVLRLLVKDDGPGMPSSGIGKRFREGLGIANTRARLEQLYGEGEHLSMINDPAGGLIVTLDIPLREVA